MNPEQQRIAIAEACGWTAREDIENFWRAVDASGNMTHELWMSERNVWSAGIPDFLHDLNAMHEAEKVLRIPSGNASDSTAADKMHKYVELLGYAIDATATQRAEAFLRTIGKWEENQ